MTTERREAISLKTNLKACLARFGCYLGRSVAPQELVPPAESRAVVAGARKSFVESGSVRRSFTVPLFEKEADRFRAYVAALRASGADASYLWIADSEACGLCRVASLSDLDLAFKPGCDPGELLAVYSADGRNTLLLDYSEVDTGVYELDVATSGPSWGVVAY